MIAPTPKKPSAMFMMAVCCAVDVEMSPMSASAPVLNTPIATPDRPSRIANTAKLSPATIRKQADANSDESDDDRGPAAETVGELSEEQRGDGDARHRGVLKRAGGGQRQIERSDHFRDDEAH